MHITTHSENETLKLGKIIAKYLKPGDIVCLMGELGTGKTILTKGIAVGLRIDKSKITSSSFILIRAHLEGRLPLYHFDLYRLEDIKSISLLGYEEYIYGDGVSIIEWAKRLKSLAPLECLRLELFHRLNSDRLIKFYAKGKRYKKIASQIYEDISH